MTKALMLSLFAVLALCFVLLIWPSCRADRPFETLVQSVKSPSGDVVAEVRHEASGGIMVPDTYEVRIRWSGGYSQAILQTAGVVSGSELKPKLTASWDGPRDLRVEVEGHRVLTFDNEAVGTQLEDLVRISLVAKA